MEINIWKTILTVIIFIVFGIAFYWYEYRPSVASSHCHKSATIFMDKQQEKGQIGKYSDDLFKTIEEAYDFRFETCMNSRGF